MSDGKPQSTDFAAWLDALNVAASARGYAGGDSFWQSTGAECWREYFDCGTTPADALTEDESYA